MTLSHDPETDALMERLRRESDERLSRMTPEQRIRLRDRIAKEVEESAAEVSQQKPPAP